jgi:hypothetical protein
MNPEIVKSQKTKLPCGCQLFSDWRDADKMSRQAGDVNVIEIWCDNHFMEVLCMEACRRDHWRKLRLEDKFTHPEGWWIESVERNWR